MNLRASRIVSRRTVSTATATSENAAYGEKQRSLNKSKGTAITEEGMINKNCELSPPALQARKSCSWISFDDSKNESRQSPKRITTLPAASAPVQAPPLLSALPSTSWLAASSASRDCGQVEKVGCEEKNANRVAVVSVGDPVFVNPNECACECHEPAPLPPPLPFGKDCHVRTNRDTE